MLLDKLTRFVERNLATAERGSTSEVCQSSHVQRIGNTTHSLGLKPTAASHLWQLAPANTPPLPGSRPGPQT